MKTEPTDEFYLRIKDFISCCYTSGKKDILSMHKKNEFIFTVLQALHLSTIDLTAIAKVLEIDRKRRLVFQYNPKWKVDDTNTAEEKAVSTLYPTSEAQNAHYSRDTPKVVSNFTFKEKVKQAYKNAQESGKATRHQDTVVFTVEEGKRYAWEEIHNK